MEISVSLLTDSKAFQEMKVEWNVLLRESQSNNVFLTWEWLHTWWEIYGKTSKLHIIAVRNYLGELIGIAPFKVSKRSILGIGKSRVLEFIGCGGDVTTEYLDIIAKKGLETIVFNSVAEFIFRNPSWTKVDLRHFSSTSPAIPIIKGFLEQRNVPCRIDRSSICPIVMLTKSWGKFLSGKSFNFRKKMKESLRVARRDLGVRLVCCDSLATLQGDMNGLIDLHLKRWGKRSRAFRTEQYVTFHRKVSRLFLENGWLRLYFIKQEDKTLAGIYCFHYNNKYYYYQSGRDMGYSKYRLGTVLLNEALKSAISEGAGEFDFLTGDEAYKYHWAQRSKETVRLSYWNDGNGRAAKYFRSIKDILNMARKRKPLALGDEERFTGEKAWENGSK